MGVKKTSASKAPRADGGLKKFFAQGAAEKAASEAPVPPPPPSAPVPAPGGQQPTTEQLEKIAAKRREALERQEARRKLQEGEAAASPQETLGAADSAVNAASKEAGEAPSSTPKESLPSASQEAPAAAGKPQLTQEQQDRIQENRRKAQERQQLKRKLQEGPAVAAAPAPAQSPAAPASTASPEKTKQLAAQAPAQFKSPAKTTPTQPKKTTPPRRKDKETPPKEAKESVPGKATQSAPPAPQLPILKAPAPQWNQYHEVYASRLKALRESVSAQARAQWGNEVVPEGFLPSITGYRASDSLGDVVLVGIMSKTMTARTNVIKLYQQHSIRTPPEEDRFQNLCSADDTLWLEDKSLRVKLELPTSEVERFCSGLVAAVRGSRTSDGDFRVTSICLAGSVEPVVPLLPSLGATSTKPGPFIAFMSGLKFGASSGRSESLSRVASFFSRSCGDEDKAYETLAASVTKLIVCGGAYSSATPSQDALREADEFFAQVASCIAVDVMPGHSDPTNACIPQAPLHPLLFPESRKCQEFKSVSNPYSCVVGGLRVLGHAGQPVVDLLRCTTLKTPLEALAMTLDAHHAAPTAPDSLAAPPATGEDPFVMAEAPHVLVSGGHPDTAHTWRTPGAAAEAGTLCLCVPDFQQRPAVLLVNQQDPQDVRILDFVMAGEQSADAMKVDA